MTILHIPLNIKLQPLGCNELPEQIIMQWHNREVAEYVLVVYQKKYKSGSFGSIKTYYQVVATEYVPGFVGIKLATLGYRDYKYHISTLHPEAPFYDESKWSLTKDMSKNIKYDIELVGSNMKSIPDYWQQSWSSK